MNNELDQDIRYLKGVGERRAKLFNKLGVQTVGALLHYYPRAYLNLTDAYTIVSAPINEPCAVRATVTKKLPAVRVRSGKTLSRVYAEDESGELEIIYFNNKYSPAALSEGQSYIFYGKPGGSLLQRTLTNPMTIKPEDTNSLAPQYPLTEGISSKVIAGAVRSALDLCLDDVDETLPRDIIDHYGLISRRQALSDIHFPPDYKSAGLARDRLIFEELLTLQLGMSLLKKRGKITTKTKIDTSGADGFITSLPYQLTGAQKRSIDDILGDIKDGVAMNRLLQGDVGSGKTVVAACVAYCAAQSGYQSAIMAPTEILANQHAETFGKLFEKLGVTVGLLTSSVKGKARTTLLERIASGECDIVVGTHALIGQAVEFKKLGLVVADEQHRFGVEQRNLLSQKGDHPHVLVMSATPIPRTLALIIYGDLDISIIDEMPPGRKKIKTYLVTDDLRARYLNFIAENVAQGHQAYIVCPLVEESEVLNETASATEYKLELEEKYFKDIPVGLVHGRLKPKEKAAVMDAFRDGDISVLVSTTVIEVGVDVPNANILIVENAERFGLSALHQLRGRIGRGAAESHCILVSSSRGESAMHRLSVLKDNDNGFEIARHDLKTRGPGDFFGKRQHGLPDLQIADLATDESVIYNAAQAAKDILDKDDTLSSKEFASLKKHIETMFQTSGGTLN